MRQLGTLPDERQARLFSEHLTTHEIRNELEADGGDWVIWIKDEDQVDDARARLERFRANPTATEFRSRARELVEQRLRALEAEEAGQRIHTRRSLFPKVGGYGVGPLTFGLILLCVAFAAYSKLGYDTAVRQALCARGSAKREWNLSAGGAGGSVLAVGDARVGSLRAAASGV